MTPEFVTETAVGVLADFLVLYSIHQGGEIDVTALFDQVFQMNQLDPEEWDKARGKVIPMIHDIFVAYLNDSQIDLMGAINAHTNRIKGFIS